LSKNCKKNALKTWRIKDNNFLFRNKIGTYVSNILSHKYQIITYSSFSTGPLPFREAFIIVIMLEKRISNISNITALVKETGVSRRALNLILEDLDSRDTC
jgi:hypothetical protein